MTTEIKICPYCYQLYVEKEECPKCNIELESLEVFAQKLDKYLEYRRGLHIDYIDPSYADDHKREGIRDYYKAYVTLIKADYQNRERYLCGLVKTYEIIDKDRDLTEELSRAKVLKILDLLLEFNPNHEYYLYMKAYLLIDDPKEALKYSDRLFEINKDNEWNNFLRERLLDRI